MPHHDKCTALHTAAYPYTKLMNAEISSLVIAFVRSELLRKHYDEAATGNPPESVADVAVVWAYLSLWLASLYVVIEAWQKCSTSVEGLRDDRLEALISSQHADALRKLRNNVFHGNKWNHRHVVEFIVRSESAITWASETASEFRRVLTESLGLGQVSS